MQRSRRKVVQHGPSTLTVSLPADWAKTHNVNRGDDLSVQKLHNGLFISTETHARGKPTTVDLTNKTKILPKTIGSLYRQGYDEITVLYDGPDELEALHRVVSTGYIGFEIVEETSNRIVIRKVSEPSEAEFPILFRRIFHFLKTTGEEGYIAAKDGDLPMYEKLVIRDANIDKLADFCRRVVAQQGQHEYRNDAALYHIIEQLEKVGDLYRDVNAELLHQQRALPEKELFLYAQANAIVSEFTDLFFSFSLEKANTLRKHHVALMAYASEIEETTNHHRVVYLLEHIPREMYNLLGVTIMLHL